MTREQAIRTLDQGTRSPIEFEWFTSDMVMVAKSRVIDDNAFYYLEVRQASGVKNAFELPSPHKELIDYLYGLGFRVHLEESGELMFLVFEYPKSTHWR